MKGVTFQVPPLGLITQGVTLIVPLYPNYFFLEVKYFRVAKGSESYRSIPFLIPNDPPIDSGKTFGENRVRHEQLGGTVVVKAVDTSAVTKVAVSPTGYVTGYLPRRTTLASYHHPQWRDGVAKLFTQPQGFASLDLRSSLGTGFIYRVEWSLKDNQLSLRRRREYWYKNKFSNGDWFRCVSTVIPSPSEACSTTMFFTWTNESTGATLGEGKVLVTMGTEPMPSVAYIGSQDGPGAWASAIKTYGRLATQVMVPDRSYDLTKTACENIAALDINNIENLSGFRDLSKLLPTKGKTAMKTVAGLYLWYKYAAKPTYSDVREIWAFRNKVADELTRTTKFLALRSSFTETIELPVGDMTVEHCAKVVMKNSNFDCVMRIFNALDSFGLAPTAANAWDLVPFSFVVDWFLGVGTLLEDLDYWLATEANRYPLRVRTYSTKSTIKLELSADSFGWVCDADILYSNYERGVSTIFPKNQFEFGRTNPLTHLFELFALVVANW